VAKSVLFGVGGSSFIPGRSRDLWGIGYFDYYLSEELLDGLNALGFNYRHEQGVEAYYNLALAPWFRVTADLQVIRPHDGNKPIATVAALRTQIKF
jgi:porin